MAITINGSGSGRETPSTVTCSSAIASSRADCVFGVARLISSASTIFEKIGPGFHSKSPLCWLNTERPITSDGSRSEVNWIRWNDRSSARARALASVVLPMPGHVLDKQMAFGEQRDQGELDGFRLAPDDPFDLVLEARLFRRRQSGNRTSCRSRFR